MLDDVLDQRAPCLHCGRPTTPDQVLTCETCNVPCCVGCLGHKTICPFCGKHCDGKTCTNPHMNVEIFPANGLPYRKWVPESMTNPADQESYVDPRATGEV